MSFISISFAFYFLPVCLLLYWVLPGAGRPDGADGVLCGNETSAGRPDGADGEVVPLQSVFPHGTTSLKPVFLLLASLLFYAWGSLINLVILLCVVALNWVLGRFVRNKIVFIAAVAANLAILAAFKYFDTGFGFPLGVSFYIFHAISYLIDVRRGKSEASTNPLTLALYLCLFTKLTMGPIVSYSALEPQLKKLKNPPAEAAADGLVKFVIGFAKKAVLAGSLAAIVTDAWGDAPNSTLSAWLGMVGYTLQLYFDFSGYSDMAVGISQMLGIRIDENFRYPYISTSVAEFWRRWHISLGGWFREYLYIPLGGNRVTPARMYLNLLLVWVATGIWHGTGFNFIVWGLWHCLFVCLERLVISKLKLPGLLGWAYTFLAVMLGWVLFNSADLASGLQYITYLFGAAADADQTLAQLLLHDNKWVLGAALIGSTPVPKEMARRLFEGLPQWFITLGKLVLIAGLLYLSITRILAEGYSPFIYTEF